ncbi:MAG: enoyl-CoA hydratase/isomerase family protein [Phycisphaerales bacterium]
MTTATPFPLTPHAAHPSIHILTLEPNQGPMVVLDDCLIRRIEATLKLVSPTCSGLILASGSPRVFIAGADLKQVQGLSVPELDGYLQLGQRVFGMLCKLHCPSVAAINGAALGGGLEIAMHCDGLVASPPAPRDGQPGRAYPIGLPEAGLSICPGWGGTNLLPARMNPVEAIQRTATGTPLTLDEAVTAKLIDRLAPEPTTQSLLATAAAWLMENRHVVGTRRDGEPSRWIGRMHGKSAVMAAYIEVQDDLPRTQAAAAVLAAVHAGLEHGWGGERGALAVERRELNRLRHTPEGAAAIAAFFEKGAKK